MFPNSLGCAVAMLAFIVTSLPFVEAGSRAWQPRITKYDHRTILDGLGRRMEDNLTISSLPPPANFGHFDKRYLIKKPAEAQLWPHNTVRYCFESQDTKHELFDNVKDAINRWWSSGLDQNDFKWEEVSDEQCKTDRAKVLVIRLQRRGNGNYATLGYTPANPSRHFDGPEMVLYNGGWGSLDKIATFAHEIGHVWGLLHEHQNPNFWRGDQGFKNANQGRVFGKANFHCTDLVGYEEAVQRVEDQGMDALVNELCTSQSFARLMSFIARDFLPLRGDEVIGQPGHEEGDVDWDSIMIYPSLTGSKAVGKPAITKPDGSYITQNTWPSPLDIVGINTLYKVGPQTPEDLLNMKSNPKSNLFRQIYGQSKGQDSC